MYLIALSVWYAEAPFCVANVINLLWKAWAVTCAIHLLINPWRNWSWLRYGDFLFVVLQAQTMLRLVVHAAACRGPCQYLNCRKLKSVFHHGKNCQTRASNGCRLCKKMWSIIQLHARACKEAECSVPRCRCAPSPHPSPHTHLPTQSQCTDNTCALFSCYAITLYYESWVVTGNRHIQEHLRKMQRLQQQSESRRRAAVDEMMKQRAHKSAWMNKGNGTYKIYLHEKRYQGMQIKRICIKTTSA